MNIQLKNKDIKRVREELQKAQNNICPICGGTIDAPVLDHEHKKKIHGSGLVRGVICRNCNVYLGRIENNCRRFGFTLEELPDVLVNISKYLKVKTNYIHPSEEVKLKLKKSSYNKLKKIHPQVPKYTGRWTKTLSTLYTKYNLEPEFY